MDAGGGESPRKMRKITVAVVSRIALLGEAVLRLLVSETELDVNLHVMKAGEADPLQGIAPLPDVLIVVLSSRSDDIVESEETLRALAARPTALRAGTIVVGPGNDAQIMRRAMQAGARDFFGSPAPREELLAAVRLIGREKGAGQAAKSGSLAAFINVKGGSGASFLAANVAHTMATQRKTQVALLDLDLQFGATSPAFDLAQRSSLLEALKEAEHLDSIALQGYMAKHVSGVHVLKATPDPLPLPWEIGTTPLARLLELALATYPNVIVDLPRGIDPLTSLALTKADHIVLVMQQSLAHVRSAKHLLRIITEHLGLAREKVLLVVNRYNDKDSVRGRDIEETLAVSAVAVVPADPRAVAESLNGGKPLLEAMRNAPLTKAVQALASHLSDGGEAPPSTRRRSLREALVGSFGGSRS